MQLRRPVINVKSTYLHVKVNNSQSLKGKLRSFAQY